MCQFDVICEDLKAKNTNVDVYHRSAYSYMYIDVCYNII